MLVGIPLGLSVWALLDAARRPQWAWSLAERNQVLWMAVILGGVLSVVCGLGISGWYLGRVRPVVAGRRGGRIPQRRRRGAPEDGSGPVRPSRSTSGNGRMSGAGVP